MKKFIFIISLIVLSFSFYKVSFAYTFSIPRAATNTEDSYTYGNNSYEKICYGPLVLGTAQITTYTLNANTRLDGDAGSSTIKIYEGGFCDSGTLKGSAYKASSTISTSTHYGDIYTFESSINTTNGNNYFIIFSETPFSTLNGGYWLGGNTAYYSNALTHIYNASSWGNATSSNACCGFNSIPGQFIGEGTSPSSISITYPTNGTSTADFANWQVQASGEIAKIKINYEDSFSSYSDTANIFSTTNGTITIPIPKNSQLAVSTSSFYSATPYILDINDNITATGTTIYFQITDSGFVTSTNSIWDFINNAPTFQNNLQKSLRGNASLTLPYTDASSTLSNCNALNFFSWGTCFVNGMTNLAGILFVPHQQVTKLVQGELNQFTTVFPFSVPFSMIQQLETISSSTPTQTDLTLTIPDLNNTTFTLLSSSTVTSTIGTNGATTYFAVWRGVLYLITGAVMFFTIF